MMRVLVRRSINLVDQAVRQKRLIMSSSSASNSSNSNVSNNKDHLQVTKDQSRSSSLHNARVESIKDISPTVKELVLNVDKSEDNHKLQFLPGQWLDVYIPNVTTVGGFSLTSTPRLMDMENKVTLAVKHSTWPPAHWVHTKCEPGSTLKIQCGGDFFISTQTQPKNQDYLFIAGGVGINPVASMIFHLHDVKANGNITLLYSAKCKRELIFKEQLDSLAAQNPKFKVEYFVTCTRLASESKPIDWEKSFKYHARRMTLDDIQVHQNKQVLMYICGPPPLIQLASQPGDQFKQVHFEKWWMTQEENPAN